MLFRLARVDKRGKVHIIGSVSLIADGWEKSKQGGDWWRQGQAQGEAFRGIASNAGWFWSISGHSGGRWSVGMPRPYR